MLGNNMFSYCQNNPVNLDDPGGNIAGHLMLKAADILLDAVISGVASAVATYTLTASWDETAKSFLVGAGTGVLYSICEGSQHILTLLVAGYTFLECMAGGASVGGSLLAAGATVYASGSFESKVLSLVVGTGVALITDSTIEAVKRNSSSTTVSISTENTSFNNVSYSEPKLPTSRAYSMVDMELTF